MAPTTRAATLRGNAAMGWRWHWLENDGSYGGYFNWVPRDLRVGRWSPAAPLFLALWTVLMLRYQPTESLSVAPVDAYSTSWYVDVATFAWGVMLLALFAARGMSAVFCSSFTGWSWIILTTRAGCAAAAALCPGGDESELRHTLLFIAEAARFPALVGATITWCVWNFVLFPLLYVFAFWRVSDEAKRERQRRAFVRWNFSFGMINAHIANLPVVVAGVVFGAGARPLAYADLYAGLCVSFVYSLLYLFVLDRLGVHFYPIFSPRTHWSGPVYTALVSLQFLSWKGWNWAIAARAA